MSEKMISHTGIETWSRLPQEEAVGNFWPQWAKPERTMPLGGRRLIVSQRRNNDVHDGNNEK